MGEASKTCNNEEPTTRLGDSEIESIKHSPVSHIPAFGQGNEDCLQVRAIVDSDEARDIFKHHPLGPNFSDNP